MSTVIETPPTQAMLREVPFDLTIDHYSRMVELGLIAQDRRVSLHDGRLYEKRAKSKAHGSVGAALTRAIDRRLPDEWSLWPESTVVLDSTNAPHSDFAVIRSGDLVGRSAPARSPGPADIGLLIEIAVSNLQADPTIAREQYARASIPTYGVLDVTGRRILVHSEPRVVDGRGEYARVASFP